MESAPRCSRCTRKLRVCICDSIPDGRTGTRTSVIILQHPREAKNSSCCSVSVIRAVLDPEKCHVLVGESFPAGTSAILDNALQSSRTLILFPCDKSEPIEAFVVDGQGMGVQIAEDASALLDSALVSPRTLILLDGTWRAAKRIVRANPRLFSASARLAHLSSLATKPSEFRFRREPKPGFVSTLEALCLALAVMEPTNTSVRAAMMTGFRRLVAIQESFIRVGRKFTGGDAYYDERERRKSENDTKARVAAAVAKAKLAEKRTTNCTGRAGTREWELVPSTAGHAAISADHVPVKSKILCCSYDEAQAQAIAFNMGKPRGSRVHVRAAGVSRAYRIASAYHESDFSWSEAAARGAEFERAILHHNNSLVRTDVVACPKADDVDSVDTSATIDLASRETLVQKAQRKNWNDFHERQGSGFYKPRRYMLKAFPEISRHLSILSGTKGETGIAAHSPVLLEIGCGSGSAMFPILQAHPTLRAVAIDISPHAVGMVKNRAADLGMDISRGRFEATVCDVSADSALQQDDVQHLLQPGVDITLLVFALSAVAPSRHSSVISSIFRATRPGGLVLFRDYGLYDCKMLSWCLDRRLGPRLFCRHENDGGTLCYFFSKEKLEDLFLAAGFERAHACEPPRYCTVRNINRKSKKVANRVFVRGAYRKPRTSLTPRLALTEKAEVRLIFVLLRSDKPSGDEGSWCQIEHQRLHLSYALDCTVAEVCRNACVNLGVSPDQSDGVIRNVKCILRNAGGAAACSCTASKPILLGCTPDSARMSLRHLGLLDGAIISIETI